MNFCFENINYLQIIVAYLDLKSLIYLSLCNKKIKDMLDPSNNEYVNTLFHTKYENKVYDYIIKISKVLNIINKYGRWIALAIIFMILTINKKNPSRSISILGMSFLLIGLVIFYGKYILLKNMQIDNIFFLSTGFSDMIKNVLNENLNKIQKLAKVLSVLGVFFIVFGNAFQKKNSKIKKNKMLYLPGY